MAPSVLSCGLPTEVEKSGTLNLGRRIGHWFGPTLPTPFSRVVQLYHVRYMVTLKRLNPGYGGGGHLNESEGALNPTAELSEALAQPYAEGVNEYMALAQPYTLKE